MQANQELLSIEFFNEEEIEAISEDLQKLTDGDHEPLGREGEARIQLLFVLLDNLCGRDSG